MAIDHQALLAAIDAHRPNAYGSGDQSFLSERRASAIEYYLGLNTNPAPEGRSQVVDRSVYETIQTMLPSLVRIFANSSDSVCKFLPIGQDDEPAAEQTTAVINNVVTEQNQWEQICADWIHDSLLMCNGYAMAYWDEDQTRVREEYEGQSDDQLAALLADGDAEVIEHTARVDEEATEKAQQAYAQAMQQYQMMAKQAAQQSPGPQGPPQIPPPPQDPGQIMVHDLVIERVQNQGSICIKVIPPEHCRISADTPDWTLRGCPYFEYRCQKTIAELRVMGLKVEDDISDDEDADHDESEDQARDRFGETSDRETESLQGPSRRVWVRMVWVRDSIERDGIRRCYYAIVVGRTVLHAEAVQRIPVSSMTPQPLPHRHIGMSVAETVMDIQDIKTATLRGGLDNLYLANNGRYAISSQVNLDDFLNARPGGAVRMLDDRALPGEGHIMPLTHPVMFDQVIGSLEYFDQMRQNRSGASRYFSGTDAGAINKTASGTMALQNMASMRVEHIARMMAPAVEELFSIVYEIWSKHKNKAEAVKLNGKWTTVSPQAWRTKRDVRISVGVGAGSKESMMQNLGMMLGAQMNLMPFRLAGPPQLYATVTEIAKMAGFSNPQKFWQDPTQLQPQQPQPTPEMIKAKSAQDLKMMELQADAQKFQAETMHRMRELQMQYEMKQRELESQLQVQAQNDMRDAERAAQQEMLKAQMAANEAENRRQLDVMKLEVEKYKADLDAQVRLALADKAAAPTVDAMAPIQELLGQVQSYFATSPEIVYDEASGKAVAVKRGDVVRPIKRGPNGRPIGLQ